MTLEEFRSYCAAKKGVVETFPFDEETLVLKVAGKMFALTGITPPLVSVNLKCDPDLARNLRDTYAGVTPGYHMNKEHWNTVRCDGSVPDELLKNLIDHSYDLVVCALAKRVREESGL